MIAKLETVHVVHQVVQPEADFAQNPQLLGEFELVFVPEFHDLVDNHKGFKQSQESPIYEKLAPHILEISDEALFEFSLEEAAQKVAGVFYEAQDAGSDVVVAMRDCNFEFLG